MALRRPTVTHASQRGAALLILLLMVLLATTYTVVSHLSSASRDAERQARTSGALAQARDALVGFAITYRDTHANEVFGFLPCPDADNNGQTDSSCGITDVSSIGRLPWQSLGLQPLRDSDSECLWYAVAGSAKDTPKTTAFNWDTLGQFVVQDASGTTTLAGITAHDRPLAVIFAPRAVIGSQTRAPAGTPECVGSLASADYLENTTISATARAVSTIRLSTSDSTRSGTNNDQGLWISSKDIFDRIKRRSDFKSDIDTLVNDLANYLNNLPPAIIPTASAGNKGIDTVITNYLAANPSLSTQKVRVLTNWRDNLLYTGGPAGSYTVNGSPTTCRALLIFGGERTTRSVAPLTAQTRSTAAEKGDITTYGDPTMYLEGANATLFPTNGAYTGLTLYDTTNPGADLIRCINGLPSGSASFDNPTDFASFTPTGVGVVTDTTTSPEAPTVAIGNASGTGGGCFWFPTAIPLAGKTLRTYYEFKLLNSDTYALGGPDTVDRGNGFTFQMVQSDGLSAPNNCGTRTTMGALPLSDVWGSISYIVQTDLHKDTATSDPEENHTAITTNGSISHTAGTMTATCDGTASGCRHSPANLFEESPNTGDHEQRIEIHTGCNATCAACDPSNHLAPNTYARIAVWVDCTDCSDVVADLDRTAKPPTIQRCTIVNTEMNSIYFGFTGGFRSDAAHSQGVTIRNFSLRSD